MHYYADYEALEFNAIEAKAKGIFPYYLNVDYSKTALCPIYHACCNSKGKLIHTQNVLNNPISFISLLNTIFNRSKKQKESYIWYHNVRYDFRIIIHELFHNGFIQVVDSDSMEFIGNYTRYDGQEKAFSIVGENLSKYIGANIYYREHRFNIRDSMSIINNGQDKILKEFGFNPKVDINWNKITLDNLIENMDSIQERCEYDVTSLSKAIEQFKGEFKDKYAAHGNTAAGISLDALKYYLINYRKKQTGEILTKKEIFREFFPQLSDDENAISKGCYHGGICTMNKEYSGKTLYNLQMVDINSSYPYAMTKPLPSGYGFPITDFSSVGFSEYIVFVDFDMTGIPFQRCHSENSARRLLGMDLNPTPYTRSEFPESFQGYLCINSVDLETLTAHAKINKLVFCKGICYDTNTMIKEFIEPLYAQRQQSAPVQKLAIKIVLNSLYGKFAQDLSSTIFLYNDMENYEKVLALDNNPFYKPVAGAVTAHARQEWVNMVYFLGKDFVYGDTDSVYFLNRKNNLNRIKQEKLFDNTALGKWSLDDKYGGYIKQARFLSKKNYLLLLATQEKKVVCVGLNRKYHKQVNFDNFFIDSKVFNIQKMVNIYGGKAMRKTVFQIKERAQ